MSSTANPATCRSGRRTTRARIGRQRDENERANGRLFRDIEFALPKELSERQQVALAREFSASVTTGTGERLPYTLAVHHGEWENPHAHLMFSERANDGIARSAEQWFRRHNPKSPDQGGGQEIRGDKAEGVGLSRPARGWAEQANRALDRAGCQERIHAGSLAQQLHRGRAPRRRRRDRAPGASGARGASRPTQPRAGRARGVVGAGGRGRLGRGP